MSYNPEAVLCFYFLFLAVDMWDNHPCVPHPPLLLILASQYCREVSGRNLCCPTEESGGDCFEGIPKRRARVVPITDAVYCSLR